jgi:hypothetical protein
VDLVPASASFPSQPFPGVPIMLLYWIAGISLFANIILVVLFILLHK